jgi:GNAT superfamily N-acetyltransferase
MGRDVEAYVAAPLAEFAIRAAPRERIWVAEIDATLAGCIAVVGASEETAQLRWFLVASACRGAGLGGRLLREALSFCRESGHAEIMLWTECGLLAAGQPYQEAILSGTSFSRRALV